MEGMMLGTNKTAFGGVLVTVATSNGATDLRGVIGDRPTATSVQAGTTWWAVDRVGEVDEVSVSTGSAWVNV